MNGYTPREAADASGFSLDTLRYYERVGLLPPVARDAGGRRRYSELDLRWLGLLRCLRDTSMQVKDVKTFVNLCQAGPGNEAARLLLLEAHDDRIEEQIAQLRRHQAYLRTKIDTYRRGRARAPTAADNTSPH